MSGNRPEPARGPPEHHLFDDVCGLQTPSSTPPSTSEFAEWTPSDLWFPSYQNLLQDETAAVPPPGSAQGNAEAHLPDRSHSSNASAAGMMRSLLNSQWHSPGASLCRRRKMAWGSWHRSHTCLQAPVGVCQVRGAKAQGASSAGPRRRSRGGKTAPLHSRRPTRLPRRDTGAAFAVPLHITSNRGVLRGLCVQVKANMHLRCSKLLASN